MDTSLKNSLKVYLGLKVEMYTFISADKTKVSKQTYVTLCDIEKR